jgi:hypothetical protein
VVGRRVPLGAAKTKGEEIRVMIRDPMDQSR